MTGHMPKDWNIATVKPFFKNSERSNCNNAEALLYQVKDIKHM
jgi:hypothetical protein